MRDFKPTCACPTCALDAVHTMNLCTSKATEVPLRCEHAADPAELAAWPVEVYRKDGLMYRPVTRVVVHDEKKTVFDRYDPLPGPNGEAADLRYGQMEVTKEIDVQRTETVCDEDATLLAGPITPPRTIKHMHRRCAQCGETWVEGVPS